MVSLDPERPRRPARGAGRRRRARGAEAPPTEPVVVDVSAATFGGDSVGRLPDGRVAFVHGVLPGESVRVQLREQRADFARGDPLEVLRQAAGRVAPPCPYFRAGCGGCSWQHAEYQLQLQLKRGIVVEQLRRIGHLANAEQLVQPAIGMLDPWHYRNQARFTVGRKLGELCFTFRGSHGLLRVDHCAIVHPRINDVLTQLQGRLGQAERRIHQVTIRVGSNTGGLMVLPSLPEVPDLDSGQAFLEEELLGTRFRLRGPSFFQVNTRREHRPLPAAVGVPPVPLPSGGVSMAELLALLVMARLAPRGHELVVDAYCGVGTFALLLAPMVAQVVGIEEARVAVADAEYNGRGVANARFLLGKTEHILPELALERRPDAVVLDPARAGAHPAVLEALLASRLRPRRIIYVSCDPTTLARDLGVLSTGGYTVDDVQPLDMFPQTYHVECVATLTA